MLKTGKDRRGQLNWLVVAEIALGSTISLLTASWAGLMYSASAGITTLLTIQNTRDKTLKTTLQRYLVFLLMLGLTRLIMVPLQFSALSFGLFLLFFVGLCYASGTQLVMASNAVLATHFLIEKNMGLPLVINEFWLLTIGATAGLMLNLLIPHQRQPLSHYRDEVEGMLKNILSAMSSRALGLCRADGRLVTCTASHLARENELMQGGFARLEKLLSAYELAARDEGGNRLQAQAIYPIKYFQMRSRQVAFLKRIWSNLERVQRVYSASRPLADFLMNIANSFSESNNALRLLEEHRRLEESYVVSALPQSRDEFEARALLYVMLLDIKSFLEIKRDFFTSLEPEEIRRYW